MRPPELEPLSASRGQGSVRIRLPDWASQAVCRVERRGEVVEQQTGPDLSFRCPGGGETVRCDGPDLEPRDLSVADVCRTGRLILFPGAPALLDSTWPLRVRVEWLDAAPGRDPVVLASRDIGFGTGLRISVHNDAHRALRFFRLGASPITLAAGDFFEPTPPRLPNPQLGGELFVSVEPAAVRPERVRLQGRRTADVDVAEGAFTSIPGLPPGRYTVTPVYEGGVRAASREVTIAEAASAGLALPAAPVGGVQLRATREQCGLSDRLRVERLVDGSPRPVIVNIPVEGGCGWRFGGLLPGRYEAYLRGPSGSQGRVRFDVGLQAVSDATVPGAGAWIRGQLTYHGHPYGQALVTATQDSASGTLVASTRTASNGEFLLTLDGPGAYSLNVTSDTGGRIPETRIVEVAHGGNHVDWSIGGGTLRVELRGAHPRASTRVTLESAAASITSTLPAGVSGLSRDALPYGEYRIWATQSTPAPRVSSAVARALLSPTSGRLAVTLDMIEHRASLIAFDPEGREVSTLEITVSLPPGRSLSAVGMRQTAAPVDPRSLAAFAPGTAIQIRPPVEFTPVCRLVPFDSELRVDFARGRSIEVRFDRPGIQTLSPALGALSGVAGSECPVPLAAFHATALPQAAGHSRFLVHNFPAAGNLEWHISVPHPARHTVSVRDGIVILPLPRPGG